MSKTLAILILVTAVAPSAGCGEKKDKTTEAKMKAEEVKNEVKEKAGGLLDRAAELKAKAEAAKETLEAAKGEAAVKLFDAAATALRVKSEFDKVYKATGAYDMEVSAEGADDAGMKAHQAKIAAMPHVTVGDLTIGYEEANEKTLNGTTFSRHFRATWAHAGRKVGLSYYTKEQLDLKAFAALLAKLAPLVQQTL